MRIAKSLKIFKYFVVQRQGQGLEVQLERDIIMGILRDSRVNGLENSFQSHRTVGIGSDVGGNSFPFQYRWQCWASYFKK